MNQAQIRAWFESRLFQWAKTKGLPIAWENLAFTPKLGQAHLRSYLLPADTTHGTYCTATRRGLFQVNVFAQENVGVKAAQDLALELETLFPIGTYESLMIDTPTNIGSGRNDDGWYMIPVKISYRT